MSGCGQTNCQRFHYIMNIVDESAKFPLKCFIVHDLKIKLLNYIHNYLWLYSTILLNNTIHSSIS